MKKFMLADNFVGISVKKKRSIGFVASRGCVGGVVFIDYDNDLLYAKFHFKHLKAKRCLN